MKTCHREDGCSSDGRGPALWGLALQEEAPTRHLSLTEGMEVYLDGKVGAVVTSTDKDKEFDRNPHTVLVQSRVQNPNGRYHHQSVYRAGDDVKVAWARWSQRGTPHSSQRTEVYQWPYLCLPIQKTLEDDPQSGREPSEGLAVSYTHLTLPTIYSV